jgi:hypothetical protein
VKTNKPFMEACDLCRSEFQMGGGDFLGHYVKYYGVTVCRGCYRAAKDGWPASAEVKLIPRLTEQGKAVPERTAKGLLPRQV